MSILLVTGSRSLRDRPLAESWVRDDLINTIRRNSVTCLFVGDAQGPDTWAFETSTNPGGMFPVLTRFVYHAQNGLFTNHAADGFVRAIAWNDRIDAIDARKRPLMRNKAMVHGLSILAKLNGQCCLARAYVDPASKTRGTQHTIDLCKAEGIVPMVRTWEGR